MATFQDIPLPYKLIHWYWEPIAATNGAFQYESLRNFCASWTQKV